MLLSSWSGPTAIIATGDNTSGRPISTLVTSDPIFQRIQAFDRSRGGAVAVRRVNRGYSLYSTATGVPIARLRSTGQADMVEVLWWRRGRWATIGDLGGVILPLDQALDYIANEPLFW